MAEQQAGNERQSAGARSWGKLRNGEFIMRVDVGSPVGHSGAIYVRLPVT